jgi:DNA-binding SARP family transcriptional activator
VPKSDPNKLDRLNREIQVKCGMPSAMLYVLGSPRLELDGVQVSFGRRKALAMLAYLAVTGEPQAREGLLALFWPDYDSSSGRTNLRRDLSYLRRTLGQEHIIADRQQVGLASEAALWARNISSQTDNR